jgi:hypothetical protein
LKRDATGNKRKELSNELAPFEQRLKQLISTQKHLEAERNQSNEQLLAERKRWREIMYNMNIVLQIVGVIFFLVIYVFCRFWYMQ